MNVRLDPQKQLVFGWDLLLGICSVVQIDSGYAAVGVDLHSAKPLEVASEGFLTELLEVEVDLVPALVQFEWH